MAVSTAIINHTHDVPREQNAILLPILHYFKTHALLFTIGFQYRFQHVVYTFAACKTNWTLSLTKLRSTEAEVSPFLAAVLQVFFWTAPLSLWPDAQNNSQDVGSRIRKGRLCFRRPVHQPGKLLTRHVRRGSEREKGQCCLAWIAVLRTCPSEKQFTTWHCQAIPSVFHRL